MSSSILRASLQLVDEQVNSNKQKKRKKNKSVFDLIPENHKDFKIIGRGGKIEKKKVYNFGDRSAVRNKKTNKLSQEIIEDNLRKLNSLTSTIEEDIAKKITQRARTGKPIIEIEEDKEDEGTVFTEEDFKKFERENWCS